VARQGIEPPQHKQIADVLAELLTPGQLQDDALVEGWTVRLSTRPPWGNPGRYGQFAAAHTWNDQFADTHAVHWARISVPLLAVAFAQDVSFPPSSARQLTETIPSAELAVIPDAGHGGVFTHAPQVSEVLLPFFAST
jgi:thioesterase CepJ